MTPSTTFRQWSRLLTGGVTLLAIALSLPPLRVLIEQSMVWHMVVQMPMLILAGWLIAQELPSPPSMIMRWNRLGLTGALTAQLILAYWMLPMAIDRAIILPISDIAKVLSLLVCGLALRDTFLRAPVVVQVFFVGYGVSMLLGLGIYFTQTELRLCNAYSQDSQIATGQGLIALAILTTVMWLVAHLRRNT